MERSRGLPDAELFLHKPAEEDCDSPTVEPLRIFKPQSPNPANDRFKYPAPPSASGSSSSFTSKPTFPLPPGASSSAAPLPYPDEEDLRPGKPTKPTITAPKRFGSDYNDTTPRFNATSPVETKSPTLAERRGTGPRPLGATSPQSPAGDDGGLFAKPLTAPQPQRPAASTTNYPSYTKKPYYPPPGGASSSTPPAQSQSQYQARPPPQSAQSADHLEMPGQNSVNRFASTASTSTTRASRGSPPPPETPIVEPGVIPGGGIEARYAASGISGTATLTSLQAQQAQSAAASQRLAQYGGAPPPARPWTPTENPENQPHGPPTVYQGMNPVTSPTQPTFSPPPQQAENQGEQTNLQVSVLEQDYQRLGLNDPPPAYSSVTPSGNPSYPAEKQRPTQQRADSTPSVSTASAAQSPPKKPATVGPAAAGLASPSLQGHPAFANDPRPEQNGQPSSSQPQNAPVTQTVQAPPSFQGAGPSSPPPLPEGWIAHLDQNSGQYYYIHLASQATQWEFPKGPNPITHEAAPLSPTASTYGNPLASPMFGKQAMASPMFPPQTPGYAESIMSVAASQTPTTAGFSGPPPSAGVDMYRIQPTNGVYFGPYLRYCNMDFEKGTWLGSIMIVTDAPQPPTIHIHPSNDLSPNPRQLVPHNIFTHQRWTFYKYDIELPMSENGTERWTYAVTSHLGCTRYEFVIAGRHEVGWRFIAHSNNDFAASTSQAERSKLGGVGFMWKDVLQKNVDCGGFHVQLGMGNQIYGDRLWKEVPLLKQWLAMSGRDNRKNAQWTARHEEDVSHAYFHYYTSHFDQPYLREAFAQIPHILQIDDHDIFDGYGSYPEYMQGSQMFKNVGRIAVEMYLLFQHHTTVEILRNVSNDMDLFTITGQGWHFVKYLGPAVCVVGPDCRSERNQARVMAGPTYQGIFPKVATLPPSVQHCIWMVSVPLLYPRLEAVESLAGAVATGKKVVNTSYNILGKVTSSVAGVVGGKDVVAQGFTQVKKAVGKSGLMGNVLNQFGEIDIAEILKDMWTHDSKDLERTYFIRTLQGISQQKGIRMTFLSGDVNCAGAGLVHDPTHPSDHKTMYQVITSPIVAQPASNYILKLLHNNKSLYVPQNGHKSNHEVSDSKEDMMEIFHTDASGSARELKKLMGRRNYVAVVAYDPETVAGGPGGGVGGSQYAGSIVNGGQQQQQQQGLQKLSLAVDFVVQGDGAFTAPTKYGPVIVPHLEFGR
ncbi:WW domain-containing protein [Colletotrichum nymphaeae SA-01]|uniref:WW domain-containing protein n=1 Tax=Colletotrichum nymphaeae SA-01 TaxID=1460502 RepID=A0A135S352_9PEZI|nr:WW domain-containing protein [Colletotrichum nymphaeae SA-01]